nr:DnaB-like helicase N-terminal domain-containing protein [Yinghuangia sp. ASG 101]
MTAEQAVLGALLLAPERLADVRAIVTESDFYRPAHAALYRAICRSPIPGAPSRGLTAARLLDTITRTEAHAAGITAVYAHTLISACPHPEHAAPYARIVAEASANRSIREHAVRLGQVARTDIEHGGITETLRHLDALHAGLDRLRTDRRFGNRTTTRPPSPGRYAAPEHISTTTDMAALTEEETVLRGIAADPEQLDNIESWFSADDFIRREHAALYTHMRELRHRGDPVDHITATWEAHRNDNLNDNGLDADSIRSLLNHGCGSAVPYAARQVLRRGLLRHAHHAARATAALAAPQRHHPHDLVAAARRLLHPVVLTRRRWGAAAGDPGPAARNRPNQRGPNQNPPAVLITTPTSPHARR